MQVDQSRSLIPTRREIAARVFRQRTVFLVCFLLVLAGFVFTGQFTPRYRAELKVLVKKQRVDPVVTAGQNSTPELQTVAVPDEDLNSEVELLKGDDLLHDVVLQAGLVPQDKQGDAVAVAKAQRKLERSLDVSAIAKTNLIDVHYESKYPEQSQKVLATLASLYMKKQQNAQPSNIQITFFTQQVKEHGDALDAAEAKLMDFTRKTGVVSADLERELTIRQASEMRDAKLQAAAAVAEASGRTEQLAIQMKAEPARIPTETRIGDNPALQNQLKSTLLQLQIKRTELLNKYDPHYRLVEDVDAEIATAQGMLSAQSTAPLREETTNVNPTRLDLDSELTKSRALLSGLRAREADLSRSAADLEKSAQSLAEQDVEQKALMRNVKTESDQYQLYIDKLEQARATHSLDEDGILNVAVVQAPVAPALPVISRAAMLVTALFTAILLSFGAAFLFDILDPTIRNAGDLAETISVPLLAEFGPGVYMERGQI
jgi:uncharacterized protein involved in exopolysaccharide biosynthesis